ncbi:MAG: amidohydrolase family protein [Pseudomonadota bacterium]|nr:MAG: amidohydrolase family protein [Pseudomonadota bacterium]
MLGVLLLSLVPPLACGSDIATTQPEPVRQLYFVDAHSQVDEEVSDLGLIVRRMDAAGVYRTILAARSGRKPGEVADFAAQHPQRIVPAVRTKSGAFDKNPANWRKFVQAQVNSGRFRAMAEMLLYHARKGNKAPEVRAYPEDDRVKFVLAAAARHGWPFVVHIEFASLAPPERERFMGGFEALLRERPTLAFLLNNMGQLQPPEAARLIKAHANLHLLTATATSVIARESRGPWTRMFEGDKLTPAWKELMLAHPDRFVFALDNVWYQHWDAFYLEQVKQWRLALAELPPSVAHAVAHGNAERLWRLEPRQ